MVAGLFCQERGDRMKRGVDFIGVSAGAMIFNDRGELLLCKRSQNAGNERGCWEVPGGAVEFGETREAAAIREMKEELGIDVTVVAELPAADHIIPADGQHWVPTTFIVRIVPGQQPRIMEPHKCDRIGWFALDRLPSPLSIITTIDVSVYRKRFSVSVPGTAVPAVDHYGVSHAVPVEAVRIRPSAYGVLIQEDRLLVVREKWTNKWELPGGGVGIDEPLTAGLVREIREETGLSVTAGPLVTVTDDYFYAEDRQDAWRSLRFYYRVTQMGGTLTAEGNGADTTGVAFMPMRELADEGVAKPAVPQIIGRIAAGKDTP
jgi:8-oxo-dGTP diphosphatase